MNEKTLELLTQLAEKTGTTVEFLWSVLVKQAFIDGVACMITGSLPIVVLIATYVVYNRLSKNEEDNEELESACFAVGGIALFLSLLMTPYFYYTGLTDFINPDYFALKTLLDNLK